MAVPVLTGSAVTPWWSRRFPGLFYRQSLRHEVRYVSLARLTWDVLKAVEVAGAHNWLNCQGETLSKAGIAKYAFDDLLLRCVIATCQCRSAITCGYRTRCRVLFSYGSTPKEHDKTVHLPNLSQGNSLVVAEESCGNPRGVLLPRLQHLLLHQLAGSNNTCSPLWPFGALAY